MFARAEATAEDRPEALDPAVLRNAQRGLGVKDLPVIFDLPLPLAIKRTEEFNRFVHPLLQRHCAKCHDGQYQGKFQLVPIKAGPIAPRMRCVPISTRPSSLSTR